MYKRIASASAGMALLASTPAFATTSTINNFTVSVSITAGCTISATNINFGGVQGNALLTTAQTSTPAMGGLFTYQCTPNTGTAPSLAASTGANPNGAQARMKGTTFGGFINYNVNVPSITAFSGASQTAQITATIPTLATVPSVDSYTDTVTLTLTY